MDGEVGRISQSEGWILRLIGDWKRVEAKIQETEIKDERKYFEETGQALFEIQKEDAIKMFNDFMKDPTLQAIKLPFNPVQNAALQLKATLIITIVSGLGPKIILEIDKSDVSSQQHLMLLLLAETEMAKEMIKQKIRASKRNVTIEETIKKK